MNKKILGSVIAVVVVCALAIFLVPPLLSLPLPQGTPQELDFTVSGTNECLRFLNNEVSICYVPIGTGANETWQLTINCTNMPGGTNAWTDVYIYKGYWDNGTDHKCL